LQKQQIVPIFDLPASINQRQHHEWAFAKWLIKPWQFTWNSKRPRTWISEQTFGETNLYEKCNKWDTEFILNRVGGNWNT